MEIKKVAVKVWIILPLLILSLISHMYLVNKYNQETVELYYNGRASVDKVLDLFKENNIIGTINYSMPYQGFMLIMTTGIDNMTDNIEIALGSYVIELINKRAIIGDKVANHNFKSIDVLGQSITIQGQRYNVAGIVINSKDIYIPFDGSFEELDWQRKKIKFNISEYRNLNILIESLQSQLRLIGIDVYDIVVRKNIIRSNDNIAILTLVYLLVLTVSKIFKDIRVTALSLIEKYNERKRVEELHVFLAKKYIDILNIIRKILTASIVLWILSIVMKRLYIPQTFIPDNLFSPSSYINIFKQNYVIYRMRLQNGIDGILIDVKLIYILLIAFILLSFTVAYRLKTE